LAVRFFEENIPAHLQNKRKLTAFLKEKIQEMLPVKKMDITYVFCTDNALLEKNRTFLNHDTFTDIITFDLSENEENLLAEIYISIERVRENALLFEVEYKQELHRVIFHGMLHLCGFKDKTDEEALEMRRQESACLQQYFKD